MLRRAVARAMTPGRRAMLGEFLRFGTVGFTGMLVDMAAAYASRPFVGAYGAGAVSYLVAATWTWQLNRMWTWRGRGSGALWKEWLRWMGVNTSGLVFNRGAYFALITFSPYCHEHLWLPIAVGAVAGMFANFFLSRRLVFR